MEIGGDDNSDLANLQFDQLVVGGAATLGGALEVLLADLGGGAFDPELGDSFPILTATTGVTGAFDSLQLPALKTGLVWKLETTSDTVRLSVANRLRGDYNGDATVDAADYTVWRDSLGLTGDHLAADGSGPSGMPDGFVDAFDYQYWKDNFGTTDSAGSGALEVPSPNSFWLIGICVMILIYGCQRRP